MQTKAVVQTFSVLLKWVFHEEKSCTCFWQNCYHFFLPKYCTTIQILNCLHEVSVVRVDPT